MAESALFYMFYVNTALYLKGRQNCNSGKLFGGLQMWLGSFLFQKIYTFV